MSPRGRSMGATAAGVAQLMRDYQLAVRELTADRGADAAEEIMDQGGDAELARVVVEGSSESAAAKRAFLRQMGVDQ